MKLFQTRDFAEIAASIISNFINRQKWMLDQTPDNLGLALGGRWLWDMMEAWAEALGIKAFL